MSWGQPPNQPPYGQPPGGYGQPQQWGQQQPAPFGSPGAHQGGYVPPPPPKKSKTGCIIGLVIGTLFLGTCVTGGVLPAKSFGSGLEVPEAKKDYVGSWVGKGVALRIQEDGTVNYLYGIPAYAVSVAAVVGDPAVPGEWTPVAGAVVDPERGRTFRARLGGGAWMSVAGAQAVRVPLAGRARRAREALTVFAFSSETWKRPAEEVSRLLELFGEAMDRDGDALARNGIRVRYIGDLSRRRDPVRDRVVQAALRMVIEPIFESRFHPHSYGFRPGRGCKDALRRVDGLLDAGRLHVVEVDIRGYFDSIPHDRLMSRVRERIADGRVLDLVEKFLGQGVMEEGMGWQEAGEGTPQGGVISPLLANIYLDPLDWQMSGGGFKWYGMPATWSCRAGAVTRP